MISIFTTPKAFSGHIGNIQRNAIVSWTKLADDIEVVLLGDDEGTAEFAAEHGLKHIPEIKRNEFGTPLVDDIFAVAQREAKFDGICYVNGDIILFPDFLAAATSMLRSGRAFLMGSRRTNFDLESLLNFDDPDWSVKLLDRVRVEGDLRGYAAIDYFFFRRGLWRTIPPFALGRWRWDNWLCFEGRRLTSCFVDATPCVTIVHQNHDYAHFVAPGADPQGTPEALKNFALAGSDFTTLTLADCTHMLELHSGEFRLKYQGLPRTKRQWLIEAECKPAVKLVVNALLGVKRLGRKLTGKNNVSRSDASL